MKNDWLALCIGNSRYHWGWFQGDILVETRDTGHLLGRRGDADFGCAQSKETRISAALNPRGCGEEETYLKAAIPWEELADSTPIYLASVVPEQTSLWFNYPNLRQITLDDIPISGLYPTMGIDRALAVWGASQVYGVPVLVIDAGTALTFTGVNDKLELVGGAILPGLKLQFESLANKTAALPEVTFPDTLPNRWATDTNAAIQSGIIYTILAGITDFVEAWQTDFEGSRVVVTGGDRSTIHKALGSDRARVIEDANLVLLGISSLLVY